MRAERVQLWHSPTGRVRDRRYLRTIEGDPREVARRVREEMGLLRVGVVEVWPLDPLAERRLRYGKTRKGNPTCRGPLAPRRPPFRPEWLPVVEAFGAPVRMSRRLLEELRTLGELVDATGLPRRRVRAIVRALDRRGLVECMEDGERWRLTPAGRRALAAVREHVEVWGE